MSTAQPQTSTKTVNLTFEVPANTDLPSETLAAMKQLLLDAVDEKLGRHKRGILRMQPIRVALCEALLTES